MSAALSSWLSISLRICLGMWILQLWFEWHNPIYTSWEKSSSIPVWYGIVCEITAKGGENLPTSCHWVSSPHLVWIDHKNHHRILPLNLQTVQLFMKRHKTICTTSSRFMASFFPTSNLLNSKLHLMYHKYFIACNHLVVLHHTVHSVKSSLHNYNCIKL